MRCVHCLYCHAPILGVQYVPDYPHVFMLYAYKACHSERKVWTLNGFGAICMMK
jgi:hypothetical protein